jgi:hypothetical protein
MDAIGMIVLSEVSQPGSGRQRTHVFSHMCRTDPKEKQIHKFKHDDIQTHV